MSDDRTACNAEHPEQPGVFCERIICCEYHRSGSIIWTQGAQPMPSTKTDSVKLLGVVRRTQAKARRSDPRTSHQAAASVGDLTVMQQAVYEALSHADMSDEQLYTWLVEHGEVQMSVSGARTRRSELVDVGMVEDSGRRELTQAGRQTIVWRVKE